MGRQIAVAMDATDEREFLDFLRGSAVVVLYRDWASTPAAVDAFERDAYSGTFWIQNGAFPWSPSFKAVDLQDEASGATRQYFRFWDREGPLIEYSRHPIHLPHPGVAGRLYWSKRFATRGEDGADGLEAFDAWFSQVTRWIRKRGTRRTHGTAGAVWFLPGALAQWESSRSTDPGPPNR